MKNPKKIVNKDGFLSKKDLTNILSIVDKQVKLTTTQYQDNMKAYEEFEKHADADCDLHKLQEQYDIGYLDGVVYSAEAIKSEIKALYAMDKKQRNRTYIRNKLGNITGAIGSLFNFLKVRK